ncbi:MAG: fluoride efflux transporter CrcB [Burkholderiaceae bacterium]|nr:fluoride efflux transporter CrcB [Burkholderiaceae bacterium]
MSIKFLSVFAISLGASLGALARWQLSEHLNHRLAHLPLGTLVANWVGAYVIGLAVAYFSDSPKISDEFRLFLITGLLGGLTTFSAFSAEVTALIQQGRWLWVSTGIVAHVAGSILLTLLGITTYSLMR